MATFTARSYGICVACRTAYSDGAKVDRAPDGKIIHATCRGMALGQARAMNTRLRPNASR